MHMNRSTQRAIIFIGLLVIIVVIIIALTNPAAAPGPAPAPGPTRPPGSGATSVPKPLPPKPNVTPGPDDPTLFFFEPEDGDTTDNPVYVRIGNANLGSTTGPVVAHLLIDTGCVTPGQIIPTDDAHLRFDKGQIDRRVELTAGQHRLCLEASDENNIALDGPGMVQVIDINVPAPVPTESHAP
jgi:hypothetical protein